MQHRVLTWGLAAAVTAGPVAAATTLTADGTTFTAAVAGWLDPGATAPVAGMGSVASRGYFAFVVSTDALYNRASLHGDDFGMMSESRIIVTYTLHDLAALPADLAPPGTTAAPGSPAAAAAATVYADAGSGTVYGTATVTLPGTATAPAGDPAVVVTLNAAGLAALNDASAASQPFLVGVSAVPRAAATAPGTVPEPAVWALLLTGFGLVGTARRALRSPALHRRDSQA